MPPSHAALLVDSDPQGLEALVYGFQGAEWRITACPNPETACLLVKASGAEIVVVAARAEHERTRASLAQLRAKETLHNLPVLVLGAEDLRPSFKLLGDVDLLPLPSFVRDVLTASHILVATRPPATEAPAEEPAYEAPLTAAGMLSLVRTMGGLLRSGLLQLSRRDRHGEVLFHEGELVGAQLGQLQGIAALQHLLLWNEGMLSLRLRAVVRRGQLRQKAQEFAEEFARFERDYDHAVKGIGPASAVYIKNDDRLMRSTGEVPAEVTPVVRLFDGLRTLADIIDESPFRILDTVRIVSRLVDFGILALRDGKPAGEGAVSRTALDEFYETARIVGPVLAAAPAEPGRDARAQVAVSSGGGPVPAAPSPHLAPPPDNPAATAPAAARTPAREVDQRGQEKTRREGERRSLSQTLQLGTRLGNLFRSRVAAPQAGKVPIPPTKAAEPAWPIPAAPAGARASGTIELRKGERRSQPTMRGFADRASVVVDLEPAESAKPRAPGPAPVSPAPVAPKTPATNPVVIPVVTKPLEATKTGSPRPAVVPVRNRAVEGTGARVTGVLEVAPAKKAFRQVPPPARVSIQLDASLDSPSPKPPLPARPPLEARPAPSVRRLAASAQVQPAAAARSRIRTPVVASSAQSSPVSSAPATSSRSRTSSTMSVAGGHSKSRPSGNFSAVESDFFAREAELYRVEKAESFADLEDKQPKPGGKPGPTGKPDKNRPK